MSKTSDNYIHDISMGAEGLDSFIADLESIIEELSNVSIEQLRAISSLERERDDLASQNQAYRDEVDKLKTELGYEIQ